MGKPYVRVVVAVVAVVAIWTAVGLYRNHVRSDGFERVAVGETRAQVLLYLGAPDHTEPRWRGFATYADKACATPCQERLWWENVLLPRGFEAWSVDLGHDGRVVHKAHWVSP